MDTNWKPLPEEMLGPKQLSLKNAIRAAVSDGRLLEGAQLPPVRELAWQLKLTPGTVARAYKELVEAGLLEAVVGRGTFVASTPIVGAGDPDTHYLKTPWPEEVVNFRSAQVADVGQGLILQNALRRLAETPAQGAYVFYPTLQHDEPLRERLATWFASERNGPMRADEMVLTFGAQHAMVMLLQTLLHGAKPSIVTEELAYPGFRHAAGLVRAGVQGVPFDAEGMIPDALDLALNETGAQVICTSAEAHNPTTMRTSLARREQIVAVARAHGAHIIDDDSFGVMASDEPGYRRLAPERSWLICSVSKTLSPELRVGAILAPPSRVGHLRLVAQQQFFGLPRPVVDLLTAVLDSGEAEELRLRGNALLEMRTEIVREILGHRDIEIRDGVPFAWLRMPLGWRASSFMRAAEAKGILMKAADEFALIDGRAPNAVRLSLTATRLESVYRQALQSLDEILTYQNQEPDI